MSVKKASEKILAVSICLLFIFSIFPNMINSGRIGEDNVTMNDDAEETEKNDVEEDLEENDEMDDGLKKQLTGSNYEALKGEPSYHSSQNKIDTEKSIGFDDLKQQQLDTKDVHNMKDAWNNYNGSDTKIGLVDSGIDFANPEIQGNYPVVEDEDSPYNGWPIAYDPKSMNKLLTQKDVSDTWYVDTSREGPGPFNYSKEINIDGTNDFPPSDEVANPGLEEKDYWDLQDLYVTRDEENWHFGFSTNQPTSKYGANVTNAIFIDEDQSDSGAQFSPKGKSANFNTSHQDTVTSVQYNTAGDLVASSGLDEKTKIWNANTGELEYELDTQENIISQTWVGDGNLVTVNPKEAKLWDVATGDALHSIEYYRSNDQYQVSDMIHQNVLDYHKNESAPQEEWLAIAGGSLIHVYNISDADPSNWYRFGSIKAADLSQGVEFSPDDSYIATGLSNDYLNVYNWTAINSSEPEDIVDTSDTEYSFDLGETVNTVSWNQDSTQLLAGNAGKGMTSIWTIPKTEDQNTVNATEKVTVGEEPVDETDDSVSDLQNSQPVSEGPTYSTEEDGWYTLESNENLSISGFDIGETGGRITEARIDFRYDVNDTEGDMADWKERYIQLSDSDGNWDTLGLQPKAGDENETYSTYINGSFDYVEELVDARVRYDFDYSGPKPGPSVSFDYINIEYKYVPGKIYQGHNSAITSAEWSADGDMVLSSEEGRSKNIPRLHLWNSTTRQIIHKKDIYQPVYSTDLFNNKIITGSRDCSLREWDTNLKETQVFRQNKPDYAIFANLTSKFDEREDGYILAGGSPDFYRWDSGKWDNPSFSDMKGKYSTGEESEFIEISIPREEISGDPQSIDVQMVSFGREMNKIKLGEHENTNSSHAQDSVPEDKNIFDRSFQYGTIDESNVPDLHLSKNTFSGWSTSSENEANDGTGDLNRNPETLAPHSPKDDDGWFTASGGNNISLDISSSIPSYTALIEDVSLEMRYSVNAQDTEVMGSESLKYMIGSDEYDTGITFSSGDNDENVTATLNNITELSDLRSLALFYEHTGDATLSFDYLKVSYDYSVKPTSLSAFKTVDIPKYEIDLTNNVSQSGTYHFGMHPSDILASKIGQPGLLVVDRDESGVYDSVIVDLDMNYVFNEDDIVLDKNTPIDYLDNLNATVPSEGDEKNRTTPDGFPDVSSGLLYFISRAETNESENLTLSDFDDENERVIQGENISEYPDTLKVYKNGKIWDDETISKELKLEEDTKKLELDGNIQEGNLKLSSENIYVENRSVYKATGGDKEFFLPHDNLEGVELYYNGTMDDWEELDIIEQSRDVKDWKDDKYDGVYCSVNTESGLVDFNPAFRLYPDDSIYASYNWTGELESGEDYEADLEEGKISFTDEIGANNTLIVEYTYDHWSVSYDDSDQEHTLKLTGSVYGDKLEEDDELVLRYSENALPVPGSKEQANVLGVDNVRPSNGDMICLMGDFEEEVDVLEESGHHGTEIASMLTGDGSGYENAQRLNDIVDKMNDDPSTPATGNYTKLDVPKIEGIAPGAEIIPVGNAYSDLYSVWNFLVKGYDGEVGTGDEADIVCNPYNIEDEQMAGWDEYSRKAEVAMLSEGKSSTLFVGSAGVQGPGYGSIVPPGGAPHMLTVGYSNMETGEDEGPNQMGPVALSSNSKGPTPMGYPKPEVMAHGKYNVSLPLHNGYRSEGSNGVDIYPSSRDGVDISSAVVTGIAALAHQASDEGFNLSVGRSILMGASNTTNANPLREGAGLVDAGLATDIASGNNGFMVDTPTWVPGNYGGEERDGFAKMVQPGDRIEKEFKVDYMGDNIPDTVSQGTFEKIGGTAYENQTFTYSYEDMLGNSHEIYDRSTGFVVNDSGMFGLNSDPEDQMMIKDEVDHYQKDPSRGSEFGVQAYPTSEKVADFDLTEEPDMVRVKAHSPYSEVYDSSGNIENDYVLSAFNWENRVGEYLEWLKTNDAPALNGPQKAPEQPWITTPNAELSNITSLTMDESTEDVGSHNSIVASTDNKIHISYYNNDTGNLEYLRLNLNLDIEKRETIDDSGDVGKYSSISFDSNDYPAISYYDETNDDLKFARFDGTSWNINVIDSTGSVGKHTSLSYLAMQGDVPLISYYDETNGDLKVAMDNGGWNVMTVDSTGDVGQYTSVAIDSGNNPKVSYYDVTNGELKYADFDGTSWNIQVIDDTGDVGKYSDMSSMATYGGQPIISYYDETNGDLKVAIDSGGWITQVVDSSGDVGKYSSVAIDGDNNPGISYYDEENSSLKYARYTDPDWETDIVDKSGDVGMFGGLEEGALYQFDMPSIIYYEKDRGDLKVAMNESSSWDINTLVRSTRDNKQYIYAGDNGEGGIQSIEVIEVRDINESAQETYVKSYVDIGVTPIDMDYAEVEGYEYVTVAAGEDGIMVVNVTQKDAPTIESSYDTAGYASNVYNVGKYVYVADGDQGLKIFDLTDMSSPIGDHTSSSPAIDMMVQGDFAYIAKSDMGVEVVDVSDPTAPTSRSDFINEGGAVNVTDARSCYVDEDHLYVADGENGVKILDISDLDNIEPLSETSNISLSGTAVDLEMMSKDVNPDRLFVSTGESGLQIIDISDRSNPELEWSDGQGKTDFNAHLQDAYFWSSESKINIPMIMTSDRFSCIHEYLPESDIYSPDDTMLGVLPTARTTNYSYNTSDHSFNNSINGPLWVSGVNGNVPECDFPTLTRNDGSYPVRTFNLSKYEPYVNQTDPNFDYLVEDTGTETLNGLNLIDYTTSSNTLSVTIDDLDSISQNGGIFLHLDALTSDTEKTNWTFEVEFFKEKPHDWITVEDSISTSGASGTFNATIDVPEDAKPGSYESSITLGSDTKSTKIPVLMNVMSENMMTEFGGTSDDNYLYSNTQLTGVSGSDENSGDWRYYYVNVPDQGRYENADQGIKMISEVDWGKKESLYPGSGTGDVSTSNITGEPDGQYSELSSGDEINVKDFNASGFDSTVNNVKIKVRHKYEGSIPEADSNNLTLSYSKEGSVLDVNVTNEVTTSELDITWDKHKSGAPSWSWKDIGGMGLDIEHKIKGLPGDGKLLIDSVWLEVEPKNVVNVQDETAILTSDMDIKIMQPTEDFGSDADEGLFGKGLSATSESSGDEGETNTNTTRSLFATSVVPGLNVIAVRNTRVDGATSPGENISGRVFPFTVNPSEGDVNTNELLDRGKFDFLSGMNLDRLNATSIGPAQSEKLSGVAIPQDDFAEDWFNSISFAELLATESTYQKNIPVEDALSLEISCWDEDGATDVDIALFLDENGNGVPEEDELVKYSGVGGSDEHIKVMNPDDGDYILTVLGYTTDDPGYIGMEISVVLAGVEGYELEDVPRQPINSFERGDFDLKWNFPGDSEDGVYGGVINLGADGTSESITVPLNVFLDTRAPEIEDENPKENEVIKDKRPQIRGKYVDDITETVLEKREKYTGDLKLGNATEDEMVTKKVEVEKTYDGTGVDADDIWVKLDNRNISSYVSVDKESNSFAFVPDKPLSEGIHHVSVHIHDLAGNHNVINWTFEVDTNGPDISFSEELDEKINDPIFTKDDEFTLEGTLSRSASGLSVSVEKDDRTMVRDEELDIEGDEFSYTLNTSEDGHYDIILTGYDSVGNDVTKTLEVYRDRADPELKITNPVSTRTFERKDSMGITGEIEGEEGDVTVWVNGVNAMVHGDGSFEQQVQLKEGENTISIKVQDQAGNVAWSNRTITRDTTAPKIEWTYEVEGTEAIITGNTSEDGKVYINGNPTKLSGNEFEEEISLRENSLNEVTISAEDDEGNLIHSQKLIDLSEQVSDEDDGEETVDTGNMIAGAILGILAALLLGLLLGFLILPKYYGQGPTEGQTDELESGEIESDEFESYDEETDEYIYEEAEEVDEEDEIFDEAGIEDTEDNIDAGEEGEIIEEEEITEEVIYEE